MTPTDAALAGSHARFWPRAGGRLFDRLLATVKLGKESSEG